MKLVNYLLVAIVIGGVIISCDKKNDPAGNPATSPLYGSWKSAGLNVTGCSDPSLNHSTSDCCGTGHLCCGNLVFTATTMANSSGLFGTGSSTSYTIKGNTFNYPSDGGVPTTFTISGATLTLTYQQTAANGNCLIESTYTKN